MRVTIFNTLCRCIRPRAGVHLHGQKGGVCKRPIMLISIASLVFASTFAPRQASDGLDYDGIVRCAGLSQAASEQRTRNGLQDARLSDAALYWGLAAVRSGAALGRTDAQIDADQTARRADAAESFVRQDVRMSAELEACLAQTPDLN